jgi:hypothetical protein
MEAKRSPGAGAFAGEDAGSSYGAIYAGVEKTSARPAQAHLSKESA